jgi:hypothetical protein
MQLYSRTAKDSRWIIVADDPTIKYVKGLKERRFKCSGYLVKVGSGPRRYMIHFKQEDIPFLESLIDRLTKSVKEY